MSKVNKPTLTSYFGYTTVILEWIAASVLIFARPLDTAEPFSQYGYYPETHVMFGVFFTVASVVYYLFSRHLDRYWQYTSLCSLIAGVAFVITGWATYTPLASTFVVDVHNLSLVVSIFFFTLPMLCIAYAKKHDLVARLSRVSYLLVTLVVFASLIARTKNQGVIAAQLATVVVFHAWVVVMNYLLLQHETAHDHSIKI